MKISQSTLADYKNISAFWESIFTEMGWHIRPSDGFDDIPAFFLFPKGFLLTIKDTTNTIVGCAGIKPLQKYTGVLKRFYLAPHLRGKGVAKQLLDEVITETKNRQFKMLLLDVYFKNLRAKRFYEKHGFTPYQPHPNPSWSESLAPDIFLYYQMNIA